MVHVHLTALVLTLILFFIALSLQKKGRNIKILKMILRVMYIIIIVTGGMLLFSLYQITILYVLKTVFGLAMIGMFEMILARSGKERNLAVFWVVFFVILIVTIYLGLQLPFGIYIFN